jgi:SAM-dependent methyltransferase
MERNQRQRGRGALRRLSRFLFVLVCYVYLPVTAVLVVLHYPYDTEAMAAAQSADEPRSARRFYEAAYQPGADAPRGLDYEATAARAAQAYDIEGTIRRFVAEYDLADKRVLEVGSGRGYLQDVVTDYTGLDLSSKVASYYHKPFVIGSATDIPFADDTFDAIWTVWVVEHISTPQKAFEEMRRVLKPGGLLHLGVAWNCPPWLADGFEVRPYADFTWAGKLVKATVPFRKSHVFGLTYLLPIRLARTVEYAWGGEATPLRFRRLDPNYEVYWTADSDAAVSLDEFEARLWFESRGDVCVNCGPASAGGWLSAGNPLIVRISK